MLIQIATDYLMSEAETLCLGFSALTPLHNLMCKVCIN